MTPQSNQTLQSPLNPAVMTALRSVRLGQLPAGHRISIVDDLWQGARVSPQVLAADLRKLQEAGILVDVDERGATVSEHAQMKAQAFERQMFLATEWPAIQRRLQELGLTASQLLGS